jgi:hypothetical protein
MRANQLSSSGVDTRLDTSSQRFAQNQIKKEAGDKLALPNPNKLAVRQGSAKSFSSRSAELVTGDQEPEHHDIHDSKANISSHAKLDAFYSVGIVVLYLSVGRYSPLFYVLLVKPVLRVVLYLSVVLYAACSTDFTRAGR